MTERLVTLAVTPVIIEISSLEPQNGFLIKLSRCQLEDKSWFPTCFFFLVLHSLQFADDHHKIEGRGFVGKITENRKKREKIINIGADTTVDSSLFSCLSWTPPDAQQLIKVGWQTEFGETSGTATVRELYRGLTGGRISGKNLHCVQAGAAQQRLFVSNTTCTTCWLHPFSFSTLPPP